MRPVLERAQRGLLESHVPGPLFLGLVALLTLRLDRFPDWDEAVFLSQNGGIDGLPAPALGLVPSREIGSVWYQSFLSNLVANYPNLRLLHIATTIVVLAAAVRTLSKVTNVPPVVLTVTLGSYWLALTYLGDFVRFTLLSFVILGALGSYLRAVSLPDPQPHHAVAPALWFSAALLLGPFEASVVLFATLLHVLLSGFAVRRPRLLVAGAVVGSLAFVVPFTVDTWVRFGSLRERIVLLRGRESPLNQSAFDWGSLVDYWSLVVRGPVSNARYAPEPWILDVALPVSAALLTVGVLAIMEGLLRTFARRPVEPLVLVVSVSVAILMTFLGGFYDSVMDQYWILPAMLLILLGTTRSVGVLRSLARKRLPEPGRRRRWAARLVLLGILAYAVPNAILVERLDGSRTGSKESESILRLTRSAIGGAECAGVARFNTPAIQWATGCPTTRVESLDLAVNWAVDEAPDEAVTFVYWDRSALTEEASERLEEAGFERFLLSGDGGPRDQVFLRR